MRNATLLTLFLLTIAFSAKGQSDVDIKRYYETATGCFKKGDYECALLNYKRYQNLSNVDVTEYIKRSQECKDAKSMADDYYAHRDYENASQQYFKICRLNPDDTYAKNRYDSAHKLVKKVIKLGKIIGGKNVSWGITTGLVVANFNTSVSGGFIGSAVDYAYRNTSEKPSYTSGTGFSIGVLLDIRLEKNIYLQIGANYINAQVENAFNNSYVAEYYNSGTTLGVDPSTTTTYVRGTGYDKYEEKYTLHYFEIPLLLSYRFKITEKINFQTYAGPYIGIGVAGKCVFTGSTDDLNLVEYNIMDDQPTGGAYHRNVTYSGELDLFGKTGKFARTNISTSWSGDFSYDFNESPLKRFNAGISLGTAFEFSGFNIGLSYDCGLINIANNGYWNSDRIDIFQNGKEKPQMEGYKHKLNKFQVSVGYIWRW